MPIKKVKPTSPGRRFATYADFAEITKTEPEKSLLEPLKKSGGHVDVQVLQDVADILASKVPPPSSEQQ